MPMTIDTKKLGEISAEALSLHDLLNDKQVEWIKREVARDRFDAVEAVLLAQQEKIDKLAKALKRGAGDECLCALRKAQKISGKCWRCDARALLPARQGERE